MVLNTLTGSRSIILKTLTLLLWSHFWAPHTSGTKKNNDHDHDHDDNNNNLKNNECNLLKIHNNYLQD